VLRPLIGMDKDEITAEAQRLGTYPVSIIPDQDCCTLFTPRHPATKARARDIDAAEATLPIEEMVSNAVAAAVVEDFSFPSAPQNNTDAYKPQNNREQDGPPKNTEQDG
jgi:tRNA uracil 4-sulfurtransferase